MGDDSFEYDQKMGQMCVYVEMVECAFRSLLFVSVFDNEIYIINLTFASPCIIIMRFK